MKRHKKKRTTRTTGYKFVGVSNTSHLEQAIAKLLADSYHVDQVRLVPTPAPERPKYNEEQAAAFERGERKIKMTNEQRDQQRTYDKFYDEGMRVIPDNDWITEIRHKLLNDGFYDHHVVIVPKDILDAVYEALVNASITTEVKGQRRFTKKVQSQADRIAKAREQAGQ